MLTTVSCLLFCEFDSIKKIFRGLYQTMKRTEKVQIDTHTHKEWYEGKNTESSIKRCQRGHFRESSYRRPL